MSAVAITPTKEQVQHKWASDLQVVGLDVLNEAARTSRPADYIATLLDTIRDAYEPREATYLCTFIMHHAEARGLLGV